MLCTAHEKLKVALSNCKKLTKSRKSNTGALWNRNDKYGFNIHTFLASLFVLQNARARVKGVKTPRPGSRGWWRMSTCVSSL